MNVYLGSLREIPALVGSVDRNPLGVKTRQSYHPSFFQVKTETIHEGEARGATQRSFPVHPESSSSSLMLLRGLELSFPLRAQSACLW